jgi:hypothetical protein
MIRAKSRELKTTVQPLRKTLFFELKITSRYKDICNKAPHVPSREARSSTIRGDIRRASICQFVSADPWPSRASGVEARKGISAPSMLSFVKSQNVFLQLFR